MSNSIFDFFGGRSSRKVEPLNENEMFDDLLPAEPETANAGSAKEAAELNLNTDEPTDKANLSAEPAASGKSPSGSSGSHWDELASELGLDLPPRPTGKREAPASSSAERKKTGGVKTSTGRRTTEGSQMVKSKPENKTRFDVDDVPETVSLEDDELETGQSHVAALFISMDEIDLETPEAHELDEDPFAAFSGAPSRSAKSRHSVEQPEPLAPQLEIVEENDIDLIDDDFVEFEVQDLKGSRGGDRERRPKRSERSARGEDRIDTDPARPSPDSAERKPGEEGRPRRRRGGRGRGQGRSRQPAEAQALESATSDELGIPWQSEPEVVETRSEENRDPVQADRGRKETGGRGHESPRRHRPEKDRGREKRDSEKRDSDQNRVGRSSNEELETETDDGDWETGPDKKKVKIPTWDDAIGGIVEQNINRHNSGKPPRGGRRKRN